MRVFLLTSHPVAPPWNSGDGNLARTLLLGNGDTDFVFVSDPADPTPWPSRHQRLLVGTRHGKPSRAEKARLLAVLLRHDPHADLTHSIVTFQRSAMTQLILPRLPAVRGRPLVITCPAGDYHPLPLLRQAQAVVALTARTAQRLRELGLPEVERIPPGIDLVRFRPGSRAGARDTLDIGDGPFLLFAGHHDPGGGLDGALELTARVRRRVPGTRLLAALRHRPGDDLARLLESLRTRIAAHGLEDAVIQLGGLANMRAALLAADVVVFQPERLGLKMELPLTILEGLAVGRPVVVSDIATLGEIGGPPAVTVGRPADDAVADRVAQLLGDPELWREASAAARTLAEDRYDARSMVAAYEDLYRRVG